MGHSKTARYMSTIFGSLLLMFSTALILFGHLLILFGNFTYLILALAVVLFFINFREKIYIFFSTLYK